MPCGDGGQSEYEAGRREALLELRHKNLYEHHKRVEKILESLLADYESTVGELADQYRVEQARYVAVRDAVAGGPV
jgi:hypothetical protein